MTGIPETERAAELSATGAAPGAATGAAAADAKADRLAQARRRRSARLTGSPAVGPVIRRRDSAAPVLSGTQRRFWFLTRFDPDHDPFLVPLVLQLRTVGGDPVDAPALVLAMRAVVARHEVLRTRIVEVDGEPVGVLDPDPAAADQVLDVTEAELPNALAAETGRPFDLAGEQPWRLAVLRTAPDTVTLAITLHHIAFDGWSAGVLLAELRSALRPDDDPVPPPVVQFSDVAAFRQTPDGREGSSIDHWTTALAGAPAALDLPTDLPRIAGAPATEDRVVHALDPEAVRGLHVIMERERCSAFMALLAAWSVVLGRWSGRHDLVVGTAVAGRTAPGTEDLIGCFVGTLALRVDVAEERSVRSLLSGVKDTVLDGLAHQHIGYEEVVEALRPRSGGGAGALFDVSLTVHTEPGIEPDLPGMQGEFVDVPGVFVQNEIELSVAGSGCTGVPRAGGPAPEVTVTAQFHAGLFAPGTVRSMLGHLEQALRALAAALQQDPDRLLGSLDLRSPTERAAQPMLTGADVPAPVIADRRVEELILGTSSVGSGVPPDAVAVRDGDTALTRAALTELAHRIGRRLVAAGVRPGDRVGLFCERSAAGVAAMLGCWSAGAAYVPVDPHYPDARIEGILRTAEVRVVLVHPTLRDRVPGDLPALPLVPPAEHDDGMAPRPAGAISADDAAYVLFTSGTTGAPKGVVVTHRNLLAYLAGFRRAVPFDDGLSWATMTTFSADLGLTNVLAALTSGGTLHVLDHDQVTDPGTVARYFQEHRIDAVKMVPGHLAALWDDRAPQAVLPRRLLILAGEGLPWELVDRIHAAAPELVLYNNYGPTETTVSVLGCAVASLSPAERRVDRPVPLGRPFPGTRAMVLDPAGRPCPVGVPGELVIAGPTVSDGYFRRPELTGQRFDRTLDPQYRSYRSGDRVRWSPSGVVEFLGRVDDQVKIRGYRVEPGEVAAAITATGVCTECVVVPGRHAGRDRLVAYLVGAAHPDRTALKAQLRAVLPDHMVPAEFVDLDAIPLSPNGKVDRGRLPEPIRGESAPALDAAPVTATEQRVAAAFAAVLAVERVGRHDDFFDLGGDSFATVKLVRALDDAVSVIDVFRAPTVHGLAAVIEHAGTSPADGSEPVLLQRLSPPSSGTVAAPVQLVCVPFGGGSPVAFVALAAALTPTPEFVVHGVDLPGHEVSRPDEPCRPLAQVAEDLATEILALRSRVVLYGHCLGGALAAATALRVQQRGGRLLGLVEAGTFPAARLPGRIAAALHRLLPGDRLVSDRAYLESLRALGGFADALDEQDQRQLMRALRHDNREAESFYTDRDAVDPLERQRLHAGVLCVVGERDRSTQLHTERYQEWNDFVAPDAPDVELAVIPRAGHFFARHQAEELAGILRSQVERWRYDTPTPRRTAVATAPARREVRTFLAVALTQILSMIGTGLTSFALGIWVLQQTGSVTAFATISVMAVLPAILAMPLAGAVADRFDRRTVMLLADAAAGVMTSALVVLLLVGDLQIWFVYLFAGIGALAGAFQRPAYLAAITQLVPKRYLGQANGLVSIGINAGDLIAALAGGVLIGLTGLPGVVAVDVVTFAAAVTVIALVRFPDRLFHRREESFAREITSGWRFIIRRPQMVAMAVFFCVFNFLFTVPVTLAAPLLLANHSPAVLGVVMAFGGLGALAGAVIMALWGGSRRRALGMVGGTGVLGLATIVTGLSPSPVLIGVGLFGVYASLLVLNAHWLSLIQTKVGLELQGRVLATNQMLAMAMMPIGFLCVGPLTGWIGERVPAPGTFVGSAAGGHASALLVVGVVLVLWCIAGLAWRPLRRMDLELPDAVGAAVVDDDKDAVQAAADRALAAVR